MKVITFANNKGGSAKTTTTTTMGHGLTIMLRNSGVQNPRVLVVDTDSQAHSTLLLTGRKDFPEDETLAGVLSSKMLKGDVLDSLSKAIAPSAWDEDLHILRASPSLDAIEESLVGRDGNVLYLKQILEPIKDNYAAILIDTCPKFSLLTKMALLASDDVVIPVAPQFLDADGLASMINKINDIRDQWERTNPEVSGVVIVKLSQKVNGHRDIRDSIINNPNMGSLYLGTIPINSEIEYSHAHKESIFSFNPRCNGARGYVQSTRALAERIFAKV